MTPTTLVLDDFNRTNSTTISANWTEADTLSIPGSTLELNTNQLRNSSGSNSVARWNVSTFGGDSEVYCDVPTLPASGDWIGLFLRMGTGGTGDGYVLEVYNDGGSPDLYLFRIDNTSYTQLGSAVTNGVAAGDALMLRAVGSTITAHRRQSGVWSTSMTRTDSTYSAAGYIGVYGAGTTFRLDDFGGGTYVPPAASTSFPFRRRMTKKAMVAR